MPRFNLFILLGFLCLVVSIQAQTVTGTFSGSITDTQGATVAGAEVRLNQKSRNLQKHAMSDKEGRFRLTGLEPGEYQVEVSCSGFASYKPEGVMNVMVGDSKYESIVLSPSIISESLNVTGGGGDSIMSGVSSRGGIFSEAENTELPMAPDSENRNYRSQVYLLPGVTPSAGITKHAPFSINGLRPVNTVNVMVDGADFNNPYNGILLGNGLNEQPLSQEALIATEVQTNNYKAEYGRAAGGTINLVTKGGGNQFHGRVYEFHRNDSFDASDPITGRLNSIKRNQYGILLNGPILKNKLFFSINGEWIIGRSSAGRGALYTFTDAERSSVKSAAIKKLLELYPLPNISGTNIFSSNAFKAQRGGSSYFGRLDYTLAKNHQVNFRYTKAESDSVNIFQQFGQEVDITNYTRSYVMSMNSNIGSNITNEARVYYTNRKADNEPEYRQLGEISINGSIGTVSVVGAERLGIFLRDYSQTHNYQASDDLSLTRGGHGIKIGGVVRFIQHNSTSTTTADGLLTFASRSDFLAGKPATYTRAYGDTRLDQRAREYALYAQDDYRLRRNLQLNIGLRWELYTKPEDKFDRVSILYKNDANNIAPRIGFAWTPGNQTDFVVRGGYGIFYTQVPMSYIGTTRFNPPNITTYTVISPTFPNLTGRTTVQSSNRTIASPDIVQPYAQQFNLTLEKRMFKTGILSLAYVGTRASHLGITRLPNGGGQWPTSGVGATTRPLAASIGSDGKNYGNGVITVLETSGSSNYHGFQAAFQAQPLNGLSMRTAYTISKAIDDISSDGSNFVDENNRRLDRAVSDYDMRQVFATSLMYSLPSLDTTNRGLRALLGGWQVSTIISMRSAAPFSILSGRATPYGITVNRINDIDGTITRNYGQYRALIPSDNLTLADLQNPIYRVTPQLIDNPIARNTFAVRSQLGTLGRNTERGDAYYDVSLGLHKEFIFGERLRMQLRSEVFNLFNTVNYQEYSNSLADTSFGTATAAYSPRTMQLVIRLNF